jgi:RNA polymerase sigma-70 factor (ECF subfamily)
MRSHAAAQTETATTLSNRALQAQALTAALTESDAAARHAAVCAGAVRYLPDLRAFANSLAANRHQADDLVQSAILRALDASHQFMPGTNFKAWAFTILRNVFYNQWRSPAAHHLALDECAGYLPRTEAGQDKTLEFCDLRRAFGELGPDQRTALMLVGVSGLEYEAAAEICGVAKGTMKSRVSRGRAMLRALMDGGPLQQRRHEVVPISTLDLVSVFRN